MTAPFFCSIQACSFFRYTRERVNSMPWSAQYGVRVSLTNTLSLSESMPRMRKGNCLALASSPAATRDCSLANKGTASVQPVQMSAAPQAVDKRASYAFPAVGHQANFQEAQLGAIPIGEGPHSDVATTGQITSPFAPAGNRSTDGFDQPVQGGRQQPLSYLGIQV